MATLNAASQSMFTRMKRAALLDVGLYEAVEADRSATAQAAAVVALVAIAQAIGSADGGAGGIVATLMAALVGWFIWSGITYLIGDKLLGGTATWGELLRTIGFAQSPGVLGILGIVPLLGVLIRFVVAIWILTASIIAIRQALDFSTARAVLTAVIGWFVVTIPMMLVRAVF